MFCDAAELVLPSSAAFSHVTAARIYGLPLVSAQTRFPERIHVITSGRRKDLVIHVAQLSAADVGVWRGRRLTTPARTFIDLAASPSLVDLVELVILGDAMLGKGLVNPAALDLTIAEHHRRGATRARTAFALLDAGAESPMETRLRLILVLAGLPRPRTQVDLFGRHGEWIARADMYYPHARLVIEYDGQQHRTDSRQYDSDVVRMELLEEAGYRVRRFRAAQVFQRPEEIVFAISRLLGVDPSPAFLEWTGRPISTDESARFNVISAG